MTAEPWILATRNHGKLRELRSLFAEAGVPVIDLRQAGVDEISAEEGLESHETFEENALAKALHFADRLAGATVIADDSGLEVVALGGAPGVRSKRWSARADLAGAELDAANNALLLERLRDVADRRARFVCAAAWVARGEALVMRGVVSGVIIEHATGTRGFGYDPHFFSTELGKTLGAATIAEKQRVSHRGRAVAALLDALRVRGAVASS